MTGTDRYNPAMDHKVPVTLLTGFLGAGKTTLLNRILRGEQGRRIAVLVNDFGSVNIDARLVDSVDGQPIDLGNGCICCTMQGGLVQSMMRLLARNTMPDHVVVEASGIADPVGVVQGFRTPELRDRTVLDGIVTVVDAERFGDARLDRELMEDQVRAADLVLVNKVDLIGERRRAELHQMLTALAPDARALETVQADAPLDVLLGIGGGDRGFSLVHAHDHRFTAWTYATDRPLAYRRVRDVLGSLPRDIFRAKGVLALADAPALQFAAQVVGRRVSIDVLGAAEDDPLTTLVFIAGGSIDEISLARQLDSCRTDAIALMADEPFQRLQKRRNDVKLARQRNNVGGLQPIQ